MFGGYSYYCYLESTSHCKKFARWIQDHLVNIELNVGSMESLCDAFIAEMSSLLNWKYLIALFLLAGELCI